VFHDIATPNTYDNFVMSINNYGQVAGYFQNHDLQNGLGPSPIGYLRTGDGIITNLPEAAPGVGFYAESINDSGVIVGTDGLALIYQNGKASHLLLNAKNYGADATAINNVGQIVIQYLYITATGAGAIHTMLYSGGRGEDIGLPNGATDVLGSAINNRGTILGTYYISSDIRYFLHSNGKFRDLGSQLYDEFNAINDCGELVGMHWKVDPTTHLSNPDFAFLMRSETKLNLEALIDPKLKIHFYNSRGINAQGQITAWGFDSSGHQAGFILTPIR
jgi:hypothetical protein